jgi:hypothetical protein
MLEVAAVASYLANHIENTPINKKAIVEWALLHDMGNIVKFKDFISPQMKMGEEYWRKVQKKFIEKYGSDAHQATLHIIKELNLTDEQSVLTLLESSDFRAISNNGYPSLETRICDYADMCVAPQGIVGFEKRIDDLIKRYNLTKEDISTQTRKDNAREIRSHISIDIEKINTVDYSEYMKNLSEYDISLKV